MYYKLNLGGKDRGLNFKMGTLRYIGELTKNDPLKFEVTNSIGGQYEVVCTIIHAALLCNCDSKNIEPDFTANDVKKWVDELDPLQAIEVIKAFTQAFQVAGGGNQDTQQ